MNNKTRLGAKGSTLGCGGQQAVMPVRHRVIVAGLLTWLIGLAAGCAAVVTEDELIRAENWYQLGFNDGKWGEKAISPPTLEARVSNVSKDLQPDYSQYQEGYQVGIEKYCSLDRVEQLGLEGKTDWGICAFRQAEGGLYQSFWQQGFNRRMHVDGPGDF